MAIHFNGSLDNLKGVNFNNLPVKEVYYNNVFVWPDSPDCWYKYVKLEEIDEQSVRENTYELHLSREQLDPGYIYNEEHEPGQRTSPGWQKPQPNVLGPNGQPYTTPMAFVRRVVFETAITPSYFNNWFAHLYGGINDLVVAPKYPFEWVNPHKLIVNSLRSYKGAFEMCHATYLDLSRWQTLNCVDTTDMFKNCSAQHIYVGTGWNMTNVKDSKDMFKEAMYLPGFNSGNKNDVTMAKLVSEGGYLEKKI